MCNMVTKEKVDDTLISGYGFSSYAEGLKDGSVNYMIQRRYREKHQTSS